eukprot:3787114-Rhodomonas_salina.6
MHNGKWQYGTSNGRAIETQQSSYMWQYTKQLPAAKSERAVAGEGRREEGGGEGGGEPPRGGLGAGRKKEE